MPSRSRLNVFISYRRDDASGNAGRLFDWLTRQFGRSRVFLDTDKIAHGADFAEVLKARLHDADVVLVVIGRAWLDIANAAGRRLDQPDDFVRLEVATALELAASGGTRVIPVLVDGAGMPAASDLPQPLQGLARLNAASLRDAGFEQDFDLLVDDMLGRPRGYLRTELDRLQRLLQALKVSSLLVPVVAVFVVLALWMGVLDEFTLDTKAASYLLWAGEQLAPAPDDPGVLLVTIDEGSEAQLQRPFGPTPAWRADHARLIERATAAGAKAVVFDLFFEQAGAADDALALAAQRARTGPGPTRVVFGVRALDAGQPRLLPALQAVADWGSLCINRRLGYTFLAPLAVLKGERDMQAITPAGIPALALAASRGAALQAVDIPRRQILLDQTVSRQAPRFSLIQRIHGDPGQCATLADGDDVAMLLIRFARAGYWQDPARHVSYADALDPARVADERLRGRVLLVGVTLPAAGDRYALSSGLSHRSVYGVELHADAIANLNTGREVVTPTVDQSALLTALAAITGAIAGFLAGPLPPLRRRLVLLGIALAYLALAVVCASQGLLLFLFYDVTAFVITYLVLRRLRSGGFEPPQPG